MTRPRKMRRRKNLTAKIPPEEYLQKLADAKAFREAAEDGGNDKFTLREDYEIGTSILGMFYAIYSGRCNVCGFGTEFRHEEQLPVREPV